MDQARTRRRTRPFLVAGLVQGAHDWPYWERELHRAWPLLTEPLR